MPKRSKQLALTRGEDQEAFQTQVDAEIVREIAQRAADKINKALGAKGVKEAVTNTAIRIAREHADRFTRENDAFETAVTVSSMIAAEMGQRARIFAENLQQTAVKRFRKAQQAAKAVELQLKDKAKGHILTESFKRQRVGASPTVPLGSAGAMQLEGESDGAGAGAPVDDPEEQKAPATRTSMKSDLAHPQTEERRRRQREQAKVKREKKVGEKRSTFGKHFSPGNEAQVAKLKDFIRATDRDIKTSTEAGQIDEILKERSEAEGLLREITGEGFTDPPETDVEISTKGPLDRENLKKDIVDLEKQRTGKKGVKTEPGIKTEPGAGAGAPTPGTSTALVKKEPDADPKVGGTKRRALEAGGRPPLETQVQGAVPPPPSAAMPTIPADVSAAVLAWGAAARTAADQTAIAQQQTLIAHQQQLAQVQQAASQQMTSQNQVAIAQQQQLTAIQQQGLAQQVAAQGVQQQVAAQGAQQQVAPVEPDGVGVQNEQGEPMDVVEGDRGQEEVKEGEEEADGGGDDPPGAITGPPQEVGETPGDGPDGRDDIMDPDEQQSFHQESFQWATGDTNYYTRASRGKLGYGQGPEASVQPIEPFGVALKPAVKEEAGEKLFKQTDERFEPFRGEHDIIQSKPQEAGPGGSEDDDVRPFAQKPFAKVGGQIIWIPFYGKTAKCFFTSEDYQELVANVVEEGSELKLKAPAPDMIRKMQETIDSVRTALRSYDLPQASLRHEGMMTRYGEWLELKQIMKSIAKYQHTTTGMYNQAGLFSGNLREAVTRAVDEAVGKIDEDRQGKLARGLQSAQPRQQGTGGGIPPSQLPAYNPFMRKEGELQRVNTTLPRFF